MATSIEILRQKQEQKHLVVGEPKPRRITVIEYEKMFKKGVYGENDKLELLNGVLYDKYEGKRHIITAEEYERMIKAGIYGENDRIELINGVIINMSPKGDPHSSATNIAATYFIMLFGNRVIVRNQVPILLADSSEPEPDVVVAAPDEMRYSTRKPTPKDIYLVIEVADTSVRYDREVKGKMYARAGIVQYVLLNLKKRELENYCEPSPKSYRSKQTLSEEKSFNLVAFPKIRVNVKDLLPPKQKV